MSEKLVCPECDSEDIKELKINKSDTLPFGSPFEYKAVVHECKKCGERGSFSNQAMEENQKEYYLAQKNANKLSINYITQHLGDTGNSMAHIERSLGLAQRTLSRWKSSGVSASGMTLMRIVHTYPWVLDVADENFDEQFAKRELISQAANALSDLLRGQRIEQDCSVTSAKDGSSITAAFTFSRADEPGNVLEIDQQFSTATS